MQMQMLHFQGDKRTNHFETLELPSCSKRQLQLGAGATEPAKKFRKLSLMTFTLTF